MSKKLYDESIISIGPSGAGKSTVAETLQKQTGMRRLCLDVLANKARHSGFRSKFRNSDEFNYYMISEVLRKAKEKNLYGIVDFGAGHSVYQDERIFEKVKKLLKPFKNVILLLPDKNKERSLEIMKNRSTGDTNDNEKFWNSKCNHELATRTVYSNGRSSKEIATDIVEYISKNNLEEK